jgi:hypothetical protein
VLLGPVIPRAGVNVAETLLPALRRIHGEAQNARGKHSGPSAAGPADAYLNWAHETIRLLRNLIRPDDLDRLVMTRRYWHLLGQGDVPDSNLAAVRAVADLELDERADAFGDLIAALEARELTWAQVGRRVVADASAYMQAPETLKTLDIGALLDTRSEDLHVLVPILVLDELERLKDRASRPNNSGRVP